MRLLTWNMEGSSAATETKWQTGVANFLTDSDVICLQECGGVPPSADLQFGFGQIKFLGKQPTMASKLYGYSVSYWWWGGGTTYHGEKPRHPRHILFLQTDTGNNKVNLAIVSKIRPVKFLSAAPAFTDSRPAIGMRIIANGVQRDIFTVHGLSGHGNDDKKLLENIKGAATAPWFALGDYNRDYWLLTVPNTAGISYPRTPTRRKSNRILDYMVGSVKVAAEAKALEASDHNAVQFNL
jgi:cytolethal distending toxin subunit B